MIIVLAVLAMHTSARAQEFDELLQRGQAILATNCSRCHAIDRTGPSRHPEAPPFRTLGQRYPIESLAEALAEGLMTGHPDMPEFVFEIDEVSEILAYLASIQELAPDNRR
jgi:mono/diheme cytochrome c family protein